MLHCQSCGKPFMVQPCHAKAKYCSQNCYRDAPPPIRHGHSNRTHTSASPTYRTWNSMLQRCLNPRHPKYSRYGAAGITVCDRWKSFENFLADMGERPSAKTIDRYPNRTGNYEPGNCRWATASEQQRNIKSNHLITFGGKTQCLADWSRETGLDASVIRFRLRQRWPLHHVLTVPTNFGNRIMPEPSRRGKSRAVAAQPARRLP